MYKGRIENTSTHQERITPALRTLQVCRLGRTTDHLVAPNSLHLVPGDACGATQRKHINIQERFKTPQHLNNTLKNDSRTYRKFILTITAELI